MQVKISLPSELVERLDTARGDVSRSIWFQRRVEEHLLCKGAEFGEAGTSGLRQYEGLSSENFKSGAPREETAAPRRPRAGKAMERAVSRADAFRGATQKRGEA